MTCSDKSFNLNLLISDKLYLQNVSHKSGNVRAHLAQFNFNMAIKVETRKGWWCPRTGKGQRLMGILAVTGYGSV